MNLTFKNAQLRVGAISLELNLTLDQNVTALFGPSGSGKTSLLELVAGLRRLDEGAILLDNVPLIETFSRTFVPARQRAIGYVPQDLALFPHLTVQQNLDYGLKENSRIRFGKLCDLLEIDGLLDRRPQFLSGGEKQRVAFARALLASPRLLLLDEPLASLDQTLKDKILPYLRRIWDEFSIPILYVTHSPNEVVSLCDEVIVVDAGKVVARGKPSEIFIPSPIPNYQLRELR